MRVALLGLVSSCVSGLEIIGYDGKDTTHNVRHAHVKKHHKHKHHPRQHHRVQQLKMPSHAHVHHYHHLLNTVHKENVQPTPALDLMKRLAATVVPTTHHPALAEIVKVAQELVYSKDESLAEATIETFHESLMKLSEITREDPPATGAIADMRADVCGSKPDLHKADCEEFMKVYCAKNEGSQACVNFFKTDKEEEEEAPEEEKKEEKEEKKEKAEEKKKDDGPPPEKLPSQGFDGEPVAHVDGETTTDDWRHEFGPGQADTYESVCAEHPNNGWCVANGYAPLFKSSAVGTAVNGIGSFALVALSFYLLA